MWDPDSDSDSELPTAGDMTKGLEILDILEDQALDTEKNPYTRVLRERYAQDESAKDADFRIAKQALLLNPNELSEESKKNTNVRLLFRAILAKKVQEAIDNPNLPHITASTCLTEMQQREHIDAGNLGKSYAVMGLVGSTAGFALAKFSNSAELQVLGSTLAVEMLLLGCRNSITAATMACSAISVPANEEDAQRQLNQRRELSANHISQCGKDASLADAHKFNLATESIRKLMVQQASKRTARPSFMYQRLLDTVQPVTACNEANINV